MAYTPNKKYGYTPPTVILKLLDAYPNARMAYSLRQLRDGYTGPAIQANRLSDSAKLDIGFDANGDLDEAALVAFAAGGDCNVQRWYDQSGNGGTVTLGFTGTHRIVVAGVVQTNAFGKPQLSGAGSNPGRWDGNISIPTSGVTLRTNAVVSERSVNLSNIGSASLAALNYGSNGLRTNWGCASSIDTMYVPWTTGVHAGITGLTSVFGQVVVEAWRLQSTHSSTGLHLYRGSEYFAAPQPVTLGTQGIINTVSIFYSLQSYYRLISEVVEWDYDLGHADTQGVIAHQDGYWK